MIITDKKTLRQITEEMRYAYLVFKHGEPGYPVDWESYRREQFKNRGITLGAALLDEFAEEMGRVVWNDKPQTKGMQDLMLDGKPCVEIFTYLDERVPGGKATVLFGFASIEQYALHCDYVEMKRRDVDRSADEKAMIRDAAIKRARGDRSKQIALYTDDKYRGEAAA